VSTLKGFGIMPMSMLGTEHMSPEVSLAT